MKTSNLSFGLCSLILTIGCFTSKPSAQAEASTDPSGGLSSEILSDLRQLLNRHKDSTPAVRREALLIWTTENEPRMEELRERLRAAPYIRLEDAYPSPQPIEVPADATANMRRFMVQEAELRSGLTGLLKQLVTASPETRRDALKEWETRTEEQRAELDKIVSDMNVESPKIYEVPALGGIPQDASQEEKVFWTEQLALMSEFNLIVAEFAEATADQRRNAFYRWHIANSERFENQQNLAKKIENEQK